jgi:hypothetical protein
MTSGYLHGYSDEERERLHRQARFLEPAERAELFAYWTELLLSGAPALQAANKVSEDVVEGMTRELELVGRDPNTVFFYSFIQARARAW